MKYFSGCSLSVLMLLAVLTLTACNKNEPVLPVVEPAPAPTQAVPAVPVRPSPSAEAAAAAPTVPQSPQTALGMPAAALDGLTWIKGEPVSFRPGKVYVVEFWATWCGPCLQTIPHLTKLQKMYQDKGVTIIGISTESPDTVRPFVEDKGDQMDYTVAVDTPKTVNAGYMEAYGQRGIPTAFIVDGAQRVVWYGHPLDNMDAVLEQVTAGTFDAAAYARAKEERQQIERELQQLNYEYISALLGGKPVEETRPLADKILEKAPADLLNQLAWWLLTEVENSKADYPTALKAAEKANTLSEGKNPDVLDTYALALFKTGKVAEAVAIQTNAVELAADDERMGPELKKRLESYKAAMAQ